jgi:hypothetical protein
LKAFAVADDFEESNTKTVLTFWEASDFARKLARAGNDIGDRPISVSEALDRYEDDLKARGAAVGNVGRVRHNLPSTLAAKVVTLLTARELKGWRTKGPSINN